MAALLCYNEAEKVWCLTKTIGSVYVNGHKMDATIDHKLGKLVHGAILTLGGALSNTRTTFIFVSNLPSYLKVHPFIFTNQQAILTTLEQMKIELICPVCQDQAVAPTIFQCGHLVCFSCHASLRSTGPRESQGRCPSCRQKANYRVAYSQPLNNAIRAFNEVTLDREELEECREAWRLFESSLRPQAVRPSPSRSSRSSSVASTSTIDSIYVQQLIQHSYRQNSSSQHRTSNRSNNRPGNIDFTDSIDWLLQSTSFSQSSSSSSSSQSSTSSQSSSSSQSSNNRSSQPRPLPQSPQLLDNSLTLFSSSDNNGSSIREYSYRNPFIEDDDIPRCTGIDWLSRPYNRD